MINLSHSRLQMTEVPQLSRPTAALQSTPGEQILRTRLIRTACRVTGQYLPSSEIQEITNSFTCLNNLVLVIYCESQHLRTIEAWKFASIPQNLWMLADTGISDIKRNRRSHEFASCMGGLVFTVYRRQNKLSVTPSRKRIMNAKWVFFIS